MLNKIAVTVLFLLFPHVACAATFEVKKLDGSQFLFIFVDGEFVEGDSRKFNDIAIGLDDAIVMFNSPGGLITEGLSIGRTIFIKRFNTGVGSNSICASVCGLAWLAGFEKFAFPSSRVGFHAIYTNPGSNMRISSAGNALVGAYLQRLGFNDELIVYATDMEPTSMQWLTAKDAERFRLNVTLIPEEDTYVESNRAVAAFPIPERVPLPTPRPTPKAVVAVDGISPVRKEKSNADIDQEGSYTEFDYLFDKSIRAIYPNIEKKLWRFASPDIYFSYVGVSNEYVPFIGNYTFIFGYDETDSLYDVCNVSRYYDRSSSLFISCKVGGEHLVSFEDGNAYLDGERLTELSEHGR